MNVLLAEYASAHDPSLAAEGAAMLNVLKQSFERRGYEVVVPGAGEFGEEIRRLAPTCAMGLVLAPDHLLAGYTQILEQHTHNLGCGFMTVALCANKVRTEKILRSHGIPVPAEADKGKKVIKPVRGCGAQGVRISDALPGRDEFSQQYIEGEHFSVSIVANRVIGDACLYFSGKPPLVLAVNRQFIETGCDGALHYRGGETPVHPSQEQKIIEVAIKTAEVLGCQGYCGIDVVAGDDVYVVDVNPRITTSLVGIAACMTEEIADILVSASKGEGTDRVHLIGSARFDTNGKISKI
jgi:predicted ATP-grasp superfamily ATP-dependent carboligase